MKQRIKVREWMESLFDISYLLIVISVGIYYVTYTRMNEAIPTLFLYGVMTLILGIGDSFHLIPRILSNLFKYPQKYTVYLGIGKLVTSISMTIFYVILYYIHKELYLNITSFNILDILFIILSVIRIILCLMPQNQWLQNKENGYWPIYRNLPFVLMGIIVVIVYSSTTFGYHDGFSLMPIAITMSFLFYLPVVLYAGKNPKVGMLMLPKTIMYIWIVFMGMSLLV